MPDLESYEITTAIVPGKEPATSKQEPETLYRCKRCRAVLTSEPEYEDYDWFLRCLVCGAKNLLVLSFQIVGWRR